MNTRANLTLVIPVYNRADLIGATLESALNQTIPFDEIIVVDDLSTDNTLAVLAAFGSSITVLSGAKLGVQRARNAGVAAARTDFITLLDSDDLLAPNYVETVTRYMAEYEDFDSIYCNFREFFDGVAPPNAHLDNSNGNGEVGEYKSKFAFAPRAWFDGGIPHGERGAFLRDITDLYLKTLEYQPLFPTGCTVRKSFYQTIGGFNPLMDGMPAEDWEYTLRALLYGRTVLCTDVMAHVRKHASNDSRDGNRHVQGETQILQFALQFHPVSADYRSVMKTALIQRRIAAFDKYFANGMFQEARSTLALIERKPFVVKFRTKQAILRLPQPMRALAWRALVRQQTSMKHTR